MMRVSVILASLLVACATATAPLCESTCAFYFCDEDADANVEIGRNAGKALTSTVCRQGSGTVGELQGGEAFRTEDGYKTRISKLGFSVPKHFFTFYAIDDFDIGHTRAGIGHEKVPELSEPDAPVEELMPLFHNQCWTLPVRAYKMYGVDGVRTVRSTNGEEDCISFSSTVASAEEVATEVAPVYPTDVVDKGVAATYAPASEYTPLTPAATPVYVGAPQSTPAAPIYTPAAPIYTPVAPAYAPTAPVYVGDASSEDAVGYQTPGYTTDTDSKSAPSDLYENRDWGRKDSAYGSEMLGY